jgi:hypothetical protein
MRPQKRVNAINWAAVAADLDGHGWAVLAGVIDAQEGSRVVGCMTAARALAATSQRPRYFAYPLPDLVQELRASLYPRLVPIANTWQERMGNAPRFPADHAEFLDRCHAAGHTRPTPLSSRRSARHRGLAAAPPRAWRRSE